MRENNPNARLEAFSDGVYAIAITLLVIDIKIPAKEPIHNVAQLWTVLGGMLPSIGAFLLSFVLIFISWVNHHNVHKLIDKTSNAFVYANAFVLLTIVFMPFPASLMGDFALTKEAAPAVFLYNAVLAVHGLAWLLNTSVVLRDNLTVNEAARKEVRIGRRHAWLALIFYFVLALLAFWLPLVSAVLTTLTLAFWLLFGTLIDKKTGNLKATNSCEKDC